MILQRIALIMVIALVISACGAKTPPVEKNKTMPTVEPKVESAPSSEPVEVQESATYVVEKEEGVLRGVGCDAEEKKLYLRLYNPSKNDWVFYTKVVPTPQNTVKVSLNGRALTSMDCGSDQLLAENEATCTVMSSEVIFREPTTEFLDDVTVAALGVRDSVKFACVSREGKESAPPLLQVE